MVQTIGLILVFIGVTGLTLLFAVALAPLFSRGQRSSLAVPLQARPGLRLISLASAGGDAASEPDASQAVPAEAEQNEDPEAARIEELFAEIFSLRTSMGEMASELRTVRRRLELIGKDEKSTPDTPDELRPVA
jgi:hypothetical protein